MEAAIGDLLNGYQLPPQRKTTERGELIQYFADKMERSAKQIAVRTSHFSIDQLYGLKSSFEDRLSRNGTASARKYFWWITRTVPA